MKPDLKIDWIPKQVHPVTAVWDVVWVSLLLAWLLALLFGW